MQVEVSFLCAKFEGLPCIPRIYYWTVLSFPHIPLYNIQLDNLPQKSLSDQTNNGEFLLPLINYMATSILLQARTLHGFCKQQYEFSKSSYNSFNIWV